MNLEHRKLSSMEKCNVSIPIRDLMNLERHKGTHRIHQVEFQSLLGI